MKKSSIIALLIAAAAMTAPSCSNLEITADQPENSGETTVFHITATAPNTKTEFGAKDGSSYPTLWTTSKDVRFSANGDALVDATPSKSGAQASFSPAFSSPAASGTIYAFSPKGTYPSVPGFTSLITVNETNDAIYLDIPSAQTPLENSVDESAQAIVAQSEYTEGNTSISMTFNHLLAYGKMQITNFGGTIKSVELQFPENVAGPSCKYMYGTGSLNNVTSNSITLDPTNVDVEDKVFWFALAPTTNVGDMKVIITDNDDATYTKTITLTEGQLPFIKGQVSAFSVNFSGVAAVSESVSGEYSTTFSGTEYTAVGDCKKDGLTWTLATDGGYFSNKTSSDGIQIGSASYPATNITMTASHYVDSVNEIVVNTRGASSTNATISVTVNSVNYKCGDEESVDISSLLNNYTFTPDGEAQTGVIVISWSQTSSKAIYLKSIDINKTLAPTLSNIAVKTAPTKITYTAGENFDPTGLVITKTMSDSSCEDVAYAGNEGDFSFNPSLSTALTTSNTEVTITYGTKTVKQSITVNAATNSFTVTSDDVVTNSSYAKYETTVGGRDWLISFGGNNKSVGTNSGNRAKCNLSSYSKYAVSPVTTSDVASVFACKTSLSNIKKISYTFNGGSSQTSTKVYLLYSSDGTTFSQLTLLSGTQGADISSGSEFTFAKCTGYFAVLFKATNSSGNWRIDDVNLTFTND